MNIQEEANSYIAEQLEAFACAHSNQMAALLELLLLQVSFMRLWNQKYFMEAMGEALGAPMLCLHMSKTLELAVLMAGLDQDEINQATAKSMEIVDYLGVIADPKRTNLH